MNVAIKVQSIQLADISIHLLYIWCYFDQFFEAGEKTATCRGRHKIILVQLAQFVNKRKKKGGVGGWRERDGVMRCPTPDEITPLDLITSYLTMMKISYCPFEILLDVWQDKMLQGQKKERRKEREAEEKEEEQLNHWAK